MSQFVYINGELKGQDKASVSVLDRGFLLGDAVYEVIPSYKGVLFHFEAHMRRLEQSLKAIRIDYPIELEAWRATVNGLLTKNSAHNGDHAVYIQVSRGTAAHRHHEFPSVINPTVLMMTWPIKTPGKACISEGLSAITVPDIRWSWCYIKATTLLPNLLVNQQAKDQGAYEAILIRDGEAIEGATSNLFIVEQGVVITPPKSIHLLGGITREVVLSICQNERWRYAIEPISEARLKQADEVWITSSTKTIYPITHLDDKAVGTGKPGPFWQQMLNSYERYKINYKNNKGL